MTREEAIQILDNERLHCGEKVTYSEGEKCEAYDMALKALQKRPKGRWIQEIHTGLIGETNEYNDTYFFRCSICGRTVFEKEPYCHCGADMRDGEEE